MLKDKKEALRAAYATYKGLLEELQQADVDEEERLREISFLEYEIKEDCNGEYFEYGRFFEKIYFNDFEEVKEMI